MSLQLGGYTRRPKQVFPLSLRIRAGMLVVIVAAYVGMGYAWVKLDRVADADKDGPREYVKYYDISTFGPAGELRTLEEVAEVEAARATAAEAPAGADPATAAAEDGAPEADAAARP